MNLVCHLVPETLWKLFLALPLSPKLAHKQEIDDKLNIDGGKHVLACF